MAGKKTRRKPCADAPTRPSLLLKASLQLMDGFADKIFPGKVTFQPVKLIVEPDFGPQEPMQTVVIKAEVKDANFDKLGEIARRVKCLSQVYVRRAWPCYDHTSVDSFR